MMAPFLWLLPVAAGAATNMWSGTCPTSWTGGSHGTAEMILTQNGNQVGGTYDHKSGTIQGAVTADRLDGTWTQNNSRGSFSFVLAVDGKSWSGAWTDSVSGGGNWSATCSGGACLGAPTATPTAKRLSATVVQCDRDTTNATNAHFNCRALVNDIGAPAQAQKPSGVVKWTATKGSFLSGDSCLLVVPDIGTSSCVIAYDAQNQDAPIGTALPVTATYGGDDLFAASAGSHTLFPGPATAPNGGIPGSALALAATAALAVLGLGIAGFLRSRAPTDTVSGMMMGGSLVGGSLSDGGDLLEGLGIDGEQLGAALATMTPAEQRQALEQLSQMFTQAAGPPSLSVPTGWPGAGAGPARPATPPSSSGGGGMGMVLSPQLMAALGPGGQLSALGINGAQLNAAISKMNPAQVQQVQEHLREMFARAIGGH